MSKALSLTTICLIHLSLLPQELQCCKFHLLKSLMIYKNQKQRVVCGFFKKMNNSMAHCNLCKKKYKHAGNTTNLRQHLTRKHPIFYTSDVSININREKPQTGSESSNDVDDNNDVDDSNEVDDTLLRCEAPP